MFARADKSTQTTHANTEERIFTGMDITCVYTSFYGFICVALTQGIHVTSDIIRTIVVRRRPNRMSTYVIT